ncbi:MAG TPA: hypothetical protein VN735_11430 [Steroidobacteraceae bacterium]|nr:hypothetical protein [Steroidobacteraceae bacterium]
MVNSRNTHGTRATALHGIHRHTWRLKLLHLAKPRLISNLLALVALFSIGIV